MRNAKASPFLSLIPLDRSSELQVSLKTEMSSEPTEKGRQIHSKTLNMLKLSQSLIRFS